MPTAESAHYEAYSRQGRTGDTYDSGGPGEVGDYAAPQKQRFF